MTILPFPLWPLAEHIEFGQNTFDGSIGSGVLFCISTSCQRPLIFSTPPPLHRLVGFYLTDHDFKQVELLLKTQPTAMILDSLDSASSEQFQTIGTKLSDLIENTRLFVVLASRNVKNFKGIRSIARKLTIIPLEPLKRESCFSYFDQVAETIPSNIRDVIFDWTSGSP